MGNEKVVVNGMVLPKRFLEVEERIRHFPVRNQDVWLCGVPKSGTTWTQEMIWMIMHDLDFDLAKKENTNARSPLLEMECIADYRSLNKVEFVSDSVNFTKKQYEKGPLCIKTHLPWDLLPKDIRDGTKTPKIIYVARNPKAVCISRFHFKKLLWGDKHSLEDLCKRFMDGKCAYTPYWPHVLQFWQRRNLPNVLFLRYEDMVENLPSTIRQIAEFLEKPLSDQQVDTLVYYLNIDNMKENPAVNQDDFIENVRKNRGLGKANGHFVRSGKAESYKTEMPNDLRNMFDQWIYDNIKDTDYLI